MRVASLESVLAVATLVSAVVVVLWSFKILYGALTCRCQSKQDLDINEAFEDPFRGGGSLRSGKRPDASRLDQSRLPRTSARCAPFRETVAEKSQLATTARATVESR